LCWYCSTVVRTLFCCCFSSRRRHTSSNRDWSSDVCSSYLILLLLAVLPFWNDLRNNVLIRAAMAGANAAVVGILAAALATPVITSGITGIAPLIIALGCFSLLIFAKMPAWAVVLIGAVAGLISGVTGVGTTW